jgi:SnoaL-like domain
MRPFLRTVLAALLCLVAHAAVVAHQVLTFDQAASATQRVAEPYFAAYIARDWDRLAPLLAQTGRFSDPTATAVFGVVRHEGKAAALKNFRENYAPIVHMTFHRTRAFFSSQHAVFEGTLDWTLSLDAGKQAVTKGMPFVTIVQVVDGLVVDHQDFADYAPFLDAVRKARSGG